MTSAMYAKVAGTWKKVYPPAPAYSDASGGTETLVANYNGTGKWFRVHVFTANSSLTITKADAPFHILAVAGGTGAAYFVGTPAPGGAVVSETRQLQVGTVPVSVGPGGPGGQGSSNPGTPSSFAGVVANPSGTSAPVADSITGASVLYGGQGGTAGTYGRGGMGQANTGEGGQPGVVIVAYEVEAPVYNVASGGTVTDVDNYNGTGEKWRVHRFAASDPTGITVTAAPQKFKVLVVGGGGGGSAGGGDIRDGYGGGGWGGSVVEQEADLPVGSTPVVVGAGGAHTYGDSNNNGRAGSASSLGTITAAGGAGGTRNAGGGGPSVTSSITGTAVTYGYPGCSNCSHTAQGRHNEGVDGRGSGGGGQEQGQNESTTFGCQGGSGVVIVAYRIG